MARMEIISGVERRRRWSKEAKLEILAPLLIPDCRTISLSERPSSFIALMDLSTSSRRRWPSLDALCAGKKVGFHGKSAHRPTDIAHRFADSIQKRTACTFMRCQRSATCIAFGKALAFTSPYPPPRSRDTT
jgi:hypothetical protein